MKIHEGNTGENEIPCTEGGDVHAPLKWERINEDVCTYKAVCDKCGAEFVVADKNGRVAKR